MQRIDFLDVPQKNHESAESVWFVYYNKIEDAGKDILQLYLMALLSTTTRILSGWNHPSELLF